MFGEYGIVPGVLDRSQYADEDAYRMVVGELYRGLFRDCKGTVRDLNGKWAGHVSGLLSGQMAHHKAGTLVSKLCSRGLLRLWSMALQQEPADDKAWTAALLRSSEESSLRLVVTPPATEPAAGLQGPVLPGTHLPDSDVWCKYAVSFRRTEDEYRRHLEPLMKASTTLQICDPYFDPSRREYRNFFAVVRDLVRTTPEVKVHIHRKCKDGSQWLSKDAWEQTSSAGISVQVTIWSDFHDRHLLTDHCVVESSNSFHINNDVGDSVGWTRHDRDTGNGIRNRFDENKRRAWLRGSFSACL